MARQQQPLSPVDELFQQLGIDPNDPEIKAATAQGFAGAAKADKGDGGDGFMQFLAKTGFQPPNVAPRPAGMPPPVARGRRPASPFTPKFKTTVNPDLKDGKPAPADSATPSSPVTAGQPPAPPAPLYTFEEEPKVGASGDTQARNPVLGESATEKDFEKKAAAFALLNFPERDYKPFFGMWDKVYGTNLAQNYTSPGSLGEQVERASKSYANYEGAVSDKKYKDTMAEIQQKELDQKIALTQLAGQLGLLPNFKSLDDLVATADKKRAETETERQTLPGKIDMGKAKAELDRAKAGEIQALQGYRAAELAARTERERAQAQAALSNAATAMQNANSAEALRAAKTAYQNQVNGILAKTGQLPGRPSTGKETKPGLPNESQIKSTIENTLPRLYPPTSKYADPSEKVAADKEKAAVSAHLRAKAAEFGKIYPPDEAYRKLMEYAGKIQPKSK